MDIKDLMSISVKELTNNEIAESEAIDNLLGGCGIKSGKGSCGKQPTMTSLELD